MVIPRDGENILENAFEFDEEEVNVLAVFKTENGVVVLEGVAEFVKGVQKALLSGSQGGHGIRRDREG